MAIIHILITLIIVGVLLWLINTYIPMDGKIKKILNVLVAMLVIVWLLSAFGIVDTHSLHLKSLHLQ
ncbi:MAG: Thivi_2564 family membrane protein [Terriglobales bacterium]